MMASDEAELVLVTGASGYLATHIVKFLQESGCRVRGTVRSLKNEVKTKPLYNLCPDAKFPLELVEADLSNEASWTAAVKGSHFVLHTASPFPAESPRNEDEIIQPAVNGTLAVLKACREAGGVKRVVLTSSIAAIDSGFNELGRAVSEQDWSDVTNPNMYAYMKSKTLAEKAAWDYVKELPEESKFELAVINPGFIMGPVLCGVFTTSMEVPKRLLQRELPLLPKVMLPVVDVRDVAQAHINAMTIPEAAGNRHIVANQSMWFQDVAVIIDKEFRPHGYNVPTTNAPSFLIKFVSIFDNSLKMVTPGLGKIASYDNTRARDVLGIRFHEVKDTIVEMCYTMIDLGMVKKTQKYTGKESK